MLHDGGVAGKTLRGNFEVKTPKYTEAARWVV